MRSGLLPIVTCGACIWKESSNEQEQMTNVFRLAALGRKARPFGQAPRWWAGTLLWMMAVSSTAAEVKETAAIRLDPYRVNDPSFARAATGPAASYAVRGGQLETMNIANIEDALKYAPNVFVRKRYIGDQNGALTLRGTHTAQSARSLVLADGLTLSNFLGAGHGFAPRWGLLAPEEIESVEVTYGPYSALYPGNALGGVVFFTTGFPESLLASAKTSWFFHDYSEYGTDDVFTGREFSTAWGDRRGRLAFFVLYNRLDNDSNPTDFRTILLSSTTAPTEGATATPVTGALTDLDPFGRPRLIYGGFGQEEVAQDQLKLKLGYQLSDTLTTTGSVVLFRRDVDTRADSYLRDASGAAVTAGRVEVAGRTFSLGSADFGFARRQETNLLGSLAVRGVLPSGWDLGVLASVFRVTDDETRHSSRSGALAASGGPGLITRAGDGNGWETWDAKAVRTWAETHQLTLGYHGDRYRYELAQSETLNWLDGDAQRLRDGQTGETLTQAWFIQDAWQLAPTWSVTAGARYERWRGRDGTRSVETAAGPVRTVLPTRSDEALSPKLSIAWTLAPAWTARLSLARADRFPTVGELYQGVTTADGTVTANDPSLRAEEAFSKDLTLERSLAGGAVRVSFFEDDVEDTLFSQTNVLTRVTNFQNIGRVRTRGVEGAYQQTATFLSGLSLQASLAFTESTILENAGFPASVGRRFPRVPRWRASLLASYEITSAWNVSGGLRYASRPYTTLDNSDTRATYGGISGYTLFDVRTSYTLGAGFTAALGVDNVTRDKYYAGHNLLQRTYFAEIKWAY